MVLSHEEDAPGSCDQIGLRTPALDIEVVLFNHSVNGLVGTNTRVIVVKRPVNRGHELLGPENTVRKILSPDAAKIGLLARLRTHIS